MTERPTFEKSPADLVERFAAAIARAGDPSTTTRKMFGYPAAFVNGNLATGLFSASWFVRLPESRLSELFASRDARPFEPMAGRPMKGYAVLADAIVTDEGEIDGWVRRALAFTATLPPK